MRLLGTSRKILMYWILGSALDCGHFRRWAGRKTPRTSKILSNQRSDHRLRHPVLLGCADDHAGDSLDRESSLSHCYLHSLVRTASGEKMSKSKGTGLDPVALNNSMGQTRCVSVCVHGRSGTDIVLSDDRLGGAQLCQQNLECGAFSVHEPGEI